MKQIKRYTIIAQAGQHTMQVRYGGKTYMGTQTGNTPDGVIFQQPDGRQVVLVHNENAYPGTRRGK